MFLRHALLAAILVSGTAAAAVAQAGEFPFRRFGSRERITVRPFVRSFQFSNRDFARTLATAERARLRLQERSHQMADRAKFRMFSSRDFAMRMRDRGFSFRDDARHRKMELRSRDMNRMRERMRSRMDHFRFEPFIMRRHTRTI